MSDTQFNVEQKAITGTLLYSISCINNAVNQAQSTSDLIKGNGRNIREFKETKEVNKWSKLISKGRKCINFKDSVLRSSFSFLKTEVIQRQISERDTEGVLEEQG